MKNCVQTHHFFLRKSSGCVNSWSLLLKNATEPSGDDGTDYRYCEVDAELVEMIEEEMNRLVKE